MFDYEREIYPEFYTDLYPVGDEPEEPKPLPEISARLRSWRGQRGLREVVEILRNDLQTGIAIRELALIESGKIHYRQELIDKLNVYLP